MSRRNIDRCSRQRWERVIGVGHVRKTWLPDGDGADPFGYQIGARNADLAIQQSDIDLQPPNEFACNGEFDALGLLHTECTIDVACIEVEVRLLKLEDA